MKINSEQMYSELDKFGESYKYPLYINLVDRSSFFSSSRNIRYGFAAISEDNSLLLAYHHALGFVEPIYVKLSSLCLKKLKISKVPLLPSYIIKLEFLVDGERKRYDVTIAGKVENTVLCEQSQNLNEFLQCLKSWEL